MGAGQGHPGSSAPSTGAAPSRPGPAVPSRPGTGPQPPRQPAGAQALPAQPNRPRPTGATNQANRPTDTQQQAVSTSSATASPAPEAAAPATDDAGENLATSATKPPLWQRMTAALGFDSKPEAKPGPEQSADESTGAAAKTSPAELPTHPSDSSVGLAQLRQGGPGNAPQSPTGPGGGQPRAGQSTSGGSSSATALLPAAAAAGAGTAVAAGKAGESSPSGQPNPTAVRRTRKARLRLSRLDPWSVMKTAFLFSIAAGIMLVVAVYAVWVVLSTSGLFSSVDGIVAAVLSSPGDTTPFRVEDYLSTQRVTGAAAVIAVIDVLLFTALATLASFLYNLAATMLGGLEVTLAED